MNHLAHIYLSGTPGELMLGNFIADSVKGAEINRFSEGIKKGIRLHRQIDEYTDKHPVVEESKRRLRPAYAKYAGVIVDIFYDHFLALHWNDYSDVPLADYAANVYAFIESHLPELPERVNHFFPYMVTNNWLLNYGGFDGIAKVLEGMSRRTSFDSHMNLAIEDLRRDHALYEKEFALFFPDLIAFVERTRGQQV